MMPEEFYSFQVWFPDAGDAFDPGPLHVELVRWPPPGMSTTPSLVVLRVTSNGEHVVYLPTTGEQAADKEAVLRWALESVNRRRQSERWRHDNPRPVPLLRQIARLVVRWAAA